MFSFEQLLLFKRFDFVFHLLIQSDWWVDIEVVRYSFFFFWTMPSIGIGQEKKPASNEEMNEEDFGVCLFDFPIYGVIQTILV